MTDFAEVLGRAQFWAQHDLNPVDATAIRNEVATSQALGKLTSNLQRFFSGPALAFGTAGIRAPMHPGPSGLNDSTVAVSVRAIAKFLLQDCTTGKSPKVVVGFDARQHSATFARIAASVLAGAGIETTLFTEHCPTPVLAFTTGNYDFDAGIMITASHNPPADNGLKLFLGSGAQIISPSDIKIQDHIATEPTPTGIKFSTAFNPPETDFTAAYVAAMKLALKPFWDLPADADFKVILTPLHGVGGQVSLDLFKTLGGVCLSTVSEQFKPDPAFPTVAFPNPEVPETLALLHADLNANSADLGLALDPDADRVAVVLGENNEALSGDDVGVLLAYFLAKHPYLLPSHPVFASSVVSSQMLVRLADHFGLNYYQTLTGFKWISRVPGLSFGYEEAIGYSLVPGLVHDKDGISAAVVITALGRYLACIGSSFSQLRNEAFTELGLWTNHNYSLTLTSGNTLDFNGLITYLRTSQTVLGNYQLTTIRDYRQGLDCLPPATLLHLGFTGTQNEQLRVMLRPSGTEAKLKVYTEVLYPAQPLDIAGLTTALDAYWSAEREKAHQVLSDFGRLFERLLTEYLAPGAKH